MSETGNVISLATRQTAVRPKPCATCRFWVPDTADFGWNRKWLFLRDGPTANAVMFARCSALGGYAELTRRIQCEGDYWEPAVEE